MLGKNAENLLGKKFNKLTVIEEAGRSKEGTVLWKCLCDCGGFKIARARCIKKGRTTSCGCVFLAKAKQINRLAPGEAAFRARFQQYNKNAIKRKLIFNLDLNQFKQIVIQNCHYCNSEPRLYFMAKSIVENVAMNGIDRKDNNIGYQLDNCLACCKICNLMKNTLSYVEFLNHINKIRVNQ